MNKKEAKKILHETLGNYIDKDAELLFACPACNHHKRKFSVNLDKHVYKCWVCDYRGRNIRRVIRSHGTYNQLQKWDAISNRSDLERFADLFMAPERREDKTKMEQWNSQKSSRASARRKYQPPVSTHSDISKNGE